MLKILIRLYLMTIVTFGAAIYLVPDFVVGVFHERFLDYNIDLSRGMQSLLVKQFKSVPNEDWPALAIELDKSFAPLRVALIRIDDMSFSEPEQKRLRHGENAIRIGDWGAPDLVASPLDGQLAVQVLVPPDPLDVKLLYWSMNVLVGAALLGCLLFWLRPHWRDLERLKQTARRIGGGLLSERTHISPRSNIGELAQVFDTMASDIEGLLNQQRDLLNAVSHELRTPLTRLDFGLALALAEDLPAASRERLQGLVGHIRELDELVLELLSYSRLQSPGHLSERVLVPLHEFVDSILGSFDEELETPDIVLDVLMQGVQEHFALDPRLTARAIQNLLRNAMPTANGGFRWAFAPLPRAVSCGWMTMASAFPSRSASAFSSRSTAWIAAGIALRAASAWGWRSAGGRPRPRGGRSSSRHWVGRGSGSGCRRSEGSALQGQVHPKTFGQVIMMLAGRPRSAVRCLRSSEGPALPQQALDPFEHQDQHRQPDRYVGQPFARGDTFSQQQRDKHQQHRLDITQQAEQTKGQQAARQQVADQRRCTDRPQQGNQGIQCRALVDHGKTLWAAVHEPPGHRQQQRHVQPQAAEVVGTVAPAQHEVHRVAQETLPIWINSLSTPPNASSAARICGRESFSP